MPTASPAPDSHPPLQAILFDYGNTLIEFGHRQLEIERGYLTRHLQQWGSVDQSRLTSLRQRQILFPYRNGYRENVPETVCRELLCEVMQADPSPSQIAELSRLRHQGFVDLVELPADVLPLLHALSAHYRLGLVSNYPWGAAIRASLVKLGLADLLEVIVISGEVGFVKPHAAPFELALRQMNLPPQACVYVGDNWLADIQGAKRLGMRAIWTRQYVPYEKFEPEPGDHQPDAVIEHLSRLPESLAKMKGAN